MERNLNTKNIQKTVKVYYGDIARNFRPGIKAGCGCDPHLINCCVTDSENPVKIGTDCYQADQLLALPLEIRDLSLGCGDPVTIASLEEGQTVLDLGSGGGIDCFLAASKVGSSGKVIGLDMTSAMIKQAQANKAQLGVDNVAFRIGEIENLPFDANSVDVIISNCVINLSTGKLRVFQEAFRVLKPGGKFSVSDIVTDGHLPENINNSMLAWAGCLAGALNVNDFFHLLNKAGFIEINILPIYWDLEMFGSLVEQEKFTEIISKNQDGETYVREKFNIIDGINKRDFGDLQTSIFSAKISAFKPTKTEDFSIETQG